MKMEWKKGKWSHYMPKNTCTNIVMFYQASPDQFIFMKYHSLSKLLAMLGVAAPGPATANNNLTLVCLNKIEAQQPHHCQRTFSFQGHDTAGTEFNDNTAVTSEK